jgi:hypothetical protein
MRLNILKRKQNMAKTFAWHNDPNTALDTSAVHFTGTLGVPGSDSLTYEGFRAVNTSGDALSDVGLFIPFAWARVDDRAADGTLTLNHYEALTWNNDRMGFIDPNFNNTGESVLLTPTVVTHPDTPDGHVAAGTVADKNDAHAFNKNSPTVQGHSSVFPHEVLNPGDLLPFASLGSFNPSESKSFEIVWTAHWSGADLGAVRVAGYAATLAPDRPGQFANANSAETYSLFRIDG